MKVSLINPPYSIRERYSIDTETREGHLPPLGLAYVAAALEAANASPSIIDSPAEGLSNDDVVNRIRKESPELIGITALTCNVHRAFELSSKLKAEFPHTPIILGGAHASCFPQETLKKQPAIDAIVFGEGELTIAEVIAQIDRSKSLSGVNGTCFRAGKRIVLNKPREAVQNLDEIPFPARHLLNFENYLPLPNQYKHLPLAHMVTSRGCPYGQCTFCFEAGRLGHRYRRSSVEHVVDEIEILVDTYGVREVSFWDDNFVLGESWMNNFVDTLKKRNLDIVWSCYARVNFVTKRILNKMAEGGCWNIFYGLESGNQDLLDLIRKGITLEQSRNATRWAAEAGIEVRGSFMIGLPGETPEKAQKTIDFAKQLSIDYAQFCITTPFPGTTLFEQAKEYGRLDMDYSGYNLWSPVFVPDGYESAEQVAAMKQKAFRDFYMRPSYVLKRISKLRSLSDVRRAVSGLKMVLGHSRDA